MANSKKPQFFVKRWSRYSAVKVDDGYVYVVCIDNGEETTWPLSANELRRIADHIDEVDI